jgi:Probable zinc-ribbon domain
MRTHPEGSAVQPMVDAAIREDLLLRCIQCGGSFLFTVGEQRFFQERNFSQPKRCRECREAKRRERSGA